MNFMQQIMLSAAKAAAQAAANRTPQPQRKGSTGGCTPCAANAYVQKLRAQVAKR